MNRSTFPVARYSLEFEVETPLQLPEYAGSALRGAFGHALRALACATRAKSCTGCMLAEACPYTSIFEPQKPGGNSLGIEKPPVPYVIEPPEWGTRRLNPGDALFFHFVLVGEAGRHLGMTILAWQRALSLGVGQGEGRARLVAVHHCQPDGETLLWQGKSILAHDRTIRLPEMPPASTLTLEFLTPLRLQENGNALPPDRITARALLMALVRRASLLSEHYASGPRYSAERFSALADGAEKIEAHPDLVWRDWTRHSSRQGRTMRLGGCIGRIQLCGDLSPFQDDLRLGEILHVGKETSFGLGGYRILDDSGN